MVQDDHISSNNFGQISSTRWPFVKWRVILGCWNLVVNWWHKDHKSLLPHKPRVPLWLAPYCIKRKPQIGKLTLFPSKHYEIFFLIPRWVKTSLSILRKWFTSNNLSLFIIICWTKNNFNGTNSAWSHKMYGGYIHSKWLQNASSIMSINILIYISMILSFVFNWKRLTGNGILKSVYNKSDISLSSIWTYVGSSDTGSPAGHLSQRPFVLVESRPLDASVRPRRTFHVPL